MTDLFMLSGIYERDIFELLVFCPKMHNAFSNLFKSMLNGPQ